MPKRKHTAEEIINKLREAEVIIASGSTVAEATRRIGVSEQTFHRWRAEYGDEAYDGGFVSEEVDVDLVFAGVVGKAYGDPIAMWGQVLQVDGGVFVMDEGVGG